VVLLDQLQRVVDDGERGQAQEVHLEQAELVEAVHVVLGDDFVLVRLVQRDEFLERLRRDDHAGGVHRALRAMPFEALGDVDHLGDAGSFAAGFVHGGLGLDGLLQLDVEAGWGSAW
jgi:hypothetical protein